MSNANAGRGRGDRGRGDSNRGGHQGAGRGSRDGGYHNREDGGFQRQGHNDGNRGGSHHQGASRGSLDRGNRDRNDGGYQRQRYSDGNRGGGGDRHQGASGGDRYQGASGGDRYQGASGGDRYQGASGGDRYQGASGGDRYQGASGGSRDGGYRNREDGGYQRQGHSDGNRRGGHHQGAGRGIRDRGYQRGSHNDGNRGRGRGGGSIHFQVNSIDVPKPNLKAANYQTEFVKRPGRSTCTNKIIVDTNFFQLKHNLNYKVCQYDIHLDKVVKPGSTIKRATETDRPISKAIYKEVLAKFFENILPEHKKSYIHDGMHCFYTIQQLPLPNNRYDNEAFQLNDRQTFDVKIIQVGIIDLSLLNNNNPSKEMADQRRTALTVLDIYFRNRYASNGSHVAHGQNLFDVKNGTVLRCFGDYADRHMGRELLFGKFISTRKVEGGMAIISDTTAAAFITFEGTAADFIKVKLGMNLNNLSDRDWYTIRDSLRGLQYTVDHFGYSRKFIADGLSQSSTDNDVFEWKEKNGSKEKNHGKVSVTAYFKRKYNKDLKYGNTLPCLTSRGDRKFPLELCKIAPQKIPKSKLTPQQEGMMVRNAAQPPSKKWEEIQKNVKELVSVQAEIITEFKIDPELVPWKLEAVVLNPPKLLYANNQPANVDNGSWNLKEHKLRNGGMLGKWAVINFSNENVDHLINTLEDTGKKMGINIPNGAIVVKGGYTEGQVKKFINNNLKVTGPESGFHLILFVLNSRDKSAYREIKRVCDTEMRIASQCIKDETLKKVNGQLCANLMLKINLRLRGINHVLDNWDISVKPDNNECMMIGADVTHPGEGDEIFCSIAAVVGSFDKELSQYGAELRAQKKNKIGGSTEEMIEHIGDMVKKLLVRFHAKNKKYPSKIIFYRDGVSEGQYPQVKHREIDDILKMLKQLNPSKPTIKLTYVICGKRMRAKIKPHDAKDMKGRSGNVPAGTTIDNGIVDPINFDFYQVPHEGIQGTSIPTHFFVLHDDNKLSADDLEKLTFYLCHTYGRCTRSISDPAPARYAHDAAYRCRDISISKFQDRLKMVRKDNETPDDFEKRKARQVEDINKSIQVPEELSMFFI